MIDLIERYLTISLLSVMIIRETNQVSVVYFILLSYEDLSCF